MASNKKNAIAYSFVWLTKDLFQHNKIQTGIKKAVNSIIINESPSIPRKKCKLSESNQT